MAQDTTGTSLTTSAAATTRQPCIRFRVDWEDAGFGSVGSWTNETAYVSTVRGDMQGSSYQHSIATVGKSVASVVYVTCRNPEDTSTGLRFSQTNADGPLYAYIGGGRIFMKRAVLEMGFVTGGLAATSEYLRQITGYIVDVDENYAQREVTFTIRDRGAAMALAEAFTDLYTDTDPKTYIQALCSLTDDNGTSIFRDAVATGDQLFDQGVIVTPYMWMDGESVWDEMAIVAESQLGRVWFDKDGDLHFEDGAHWVAPATNAWDDPTVSQATFTVTAFRDCSPSIDVDNVYNHIVVEYAPFYQGQTQTIYSESQTLAIKPDSTLTHGVEFQYPVVEDTSIPAGNLAAATAGGINITSRLTTSSTETATRAEYAITNTTPSGYTPYTAFVTRFDVQGTPLLSGNVAEYEVEDTDSIELFGRKTWTVRNEYVQHYRHAQMVGDFLLARYRMPVTHLTLRGVPARPWLEVGDRVRVVEAATGISSFCHIGRIEWSFSARNALYTQTLHVMPKDDLFEYSNYFILDTSRFGTGDGRGRLFW